MPWNRIIDFGLTNHVLSFGGMSGWCSNPRVLKCSRRGLGSDHSSEPVGVRDGARFSPSVGTCGSQHGRDDEHPCKIIQFSYQEERLLLPKDGSCYLIKPKVLLLIGRVRSFVTTSGYPKIATMHTGAFPPPSPWEKERAIVNRSAPKPKILKSGCWLDHHRSRQS
jgi:hypothetical protein